MVKSEHIEAVLVDLSFMLIKHISRRKSNVPKNSTNRITQENEEIANKDISDIIFWILTVSIYRQRDVVKVVAST